MRQNLGLYRDDRTSTPSSSTFTVRAVPVSFMHTLSLDKVVPFHSVIELMYGPQLVERLKYYLLIQSNPSLRSDNVSRYDQPERPRTFSSIVH